MTMRFTCHSLGAVLAAASLLLALTPAAAAVRQVTIIAREGQFIGAGEWPILSVNAAFTNGDGQPGFTGTANVGDSTENFVWINAGVALRSGQIVSPVLTSFESTMGVGDGGKFVFSPAADGLDSLRTAAGQIIIQGDPAPGEPVGSNITFSSRPSMLPDGTIYWISGIDTTADNLTDGRILYRLGDGVTPSLAQKIMATGDLVDGTPIDLPDGVNFDYKFSDNGTHHIQLIRLETGSTANDSIVWRDGSIVAREGSPTDGDDNWSAFNIPSINNDGTYVFAATTNAAAASNSVLACNGVVAIREGDMLDGVTLGNGSFVEAVGINNQGIAAFVWILGGIPTEHLFAGAAELLDESKNILSTGDILDTDNDGTAEWTVTDVKPTTGLPGLDVAEDGRVLIEVEIEPINPPGSALEAIIAVPINISVEVTMTVRLFNPGETCGNMCGSDEDITIDAGQTVEICYSITNTGVMPLTVHDLTDSALGPILVNFPYTLIPGASAFLTQCDSPAETTTYTGVWSATLGNAAGAAGADSTDSVTVTVNPAIGTGWMSR